jgi:hypothetical protein
MRYLISIIFVLLVVDFLQAKETIPAGTIIPCQLENPTVHGDWIRWQAVALNDLFYHGRISVHKGETVVRIVVRKDSRPSLNGGELVSASGKKEIRLIRTGFTQGQIISVLFERKTEK